MFIDTCFLAQRDCRNFLPEPCNTHSGEELPSLFRLFQVGLFSRQAWYIAANQPYVHQTSQKKACIQIISPKVLQESTSILQLKVYIVYMVRKLVGHPS